MPKHLTAEELKKFEQQKKNLREIRKKFPLKDHDDYVPADFMTPENVRIETILHYTKSLELASDSDEDLEKDLEKDFAKFIEENRDYIDTPVFDDNSYKSLLQYAKDSGYSDLLISIVGREGFSEKSHSDIYSYAPLNFCEALGRKKLQELNDSSRKIYQLLQVENPADADQRKKSIQELIKKGFNRDSENLAEIAAKEGFYDLIEPLRNSEQIYYNDSALHIAAKSGSEELLQQLLNSGYDINSVNKEGKTAVIVAGGKDSENGKFLNGFRCEKENKFATYSLETFDSTTEKVNLFRSKNSGGYVSDEESTSDDEESVTKPTNHIKTKLPDTNQIAESLATTGTFFDGSKNSEALAAEKIREFLSVRESKKDSEPNDAKNLYKKVSDEVVIDLKTQALAEAANIYRDEVVSNKLARALKKLEGIKENTSEGLFGKMWTGLLTKVDRQILHDFYQSQNPSTDFVESDDVFDSSKLKADPALWKSDSEFLTKMMKWCVEEADLRKEITAEIIKTSEERNKDLYGRNGEEGKINQAVNAFEDPGKSPSNPGGEPILSALQTRLLKS